MALPLGKEADVKKPVRFAAILILLLQMPVSFAQFKPGNVFVSDAAGKFCSRGDRYGWDRIWEINPDTGEYRLFAELRDADCGFVTGLAFSPDGCHLRAAQLLRNRVLEFAADGSWQVVLDWDDGIRGPRGANNLAYDSQGDFFVSNADAVLWFRGGESPGAVFAIPGAGYGSPSEIAFAVDGDLYYSHQTGESYIVRITPDGTIVPFLTFTTRAAIGLASGGTGELFAAIIDIDDARSGVYVYQPGVPTSEQPIVTGPPFSINNRFAIAVAPDEQVLYVARWREGSVMSLGLSERTIVPLAVISGAHAFAEGIAVVPVLTGDVDHDGTTALSDWKIVLDCVLSAHGSKAPVCRRGDLNGDNSLNLKDVAEFQRAFGRISPQCP